MLQERVQNYSTFVCGTISASSSEANGFLCFCAHVTRVIHSTHTHTHTRTHTYLLFESRRFIHHETPKLRTIVPTCVFPHVSCVFTAVSFPHQVDIAAESTSTVTGRLPQRLLSHTITHCLWLPSSLLANFEMF